MDRRLIIIAFILLLFTPQTFAATYYVANGGNDEAAGTAEAPWETVAQAISTDVQEGDIVYFNSGDTWTVSGEAPFTTRTGVTYDGKYWGDGTRATIKYPSGSTAYPVVMINGTPANTANRSIFRGFNVDITGGKASGIGIGVNATASYVTVDDCVVHDIDSTGVVFNYAILAGYGAGDISEVIVENCTLYNIPQEILCAYVTENGSVRSTIFRHNTIYTGGLSNSYSGWGAGIEVKNDVDGLIIEYNTIYDNNYAGIHIHHAEYGTPTNITIRYNIIHTNVCGIHWQGGGGTHYVYGNLFYANGYHAHDVITSVDADINLPNTGTFYVYNNSIHRSIAADSSGGAIHVGSGGTVEVKNNAIYSSAAPGYYDSSSVATHSDNMIYRTESGTAATDGASNYTSASITNWDETALGSDPTFVGGTLPTGFSGTYGTNMVPNTDYFQLTVDSPAKDAGATLASYTGSINGAGLTTPIVRPLGAAYDIGAYEYGTVAQSGGSAGSGFKMQGASINSHGTASCSASTDYIGNKGEGTVGDYIHPVQYNQCWAYTPSCSGAVNTAYVYHRGTGENKIKVALYSKSTTAPAVTDALLAQSAEITSSTNEEWASGAMGSYSVNSATTYWICVDAQTATNGGWPAYLASGDSNRYEKNISSTTFPDNLADDYTGPTDDRIPSLYISIGE